MAANGITTMEVKKINRHNIYTFIYEQKTASKQRISEALHLSLSTVTQNLKLLESEGLICRNGYYESTGGRKAHQIEIVPDAGIALGIGILKEKIHLAAIDLYGRILKSTTAELAFCMEDEYYKKLGNFTSSFISENILEKEKLLGAGIAIQGVVSEDGMRVKYGRILNNAELTAAELTRYLPCPSRLFHDSKAAAEAELWNHQDLKNAIILLLNDNLGGALLLDGKIHNGLHMYGGLIEHISLDAGGPLCYCGSHGCLETFLSAESLRKKAGCGLEHFFSLLRNKDERTCEIWEEYLNTLSFSIRNLQLLTDGSTIISGLLNSYMVQEDFEYICNVWQKQTPFPEQISTLIAGQHGSLAPAIGSGLFFIKDWLEKI